MHARRRSNVSTQRISLRTRWALATVLLLAAMFMAAAAHAEGEIAATVVDAHGMPVADAVVVAVPVDGAMRLPSRRDAVVDQVDKEFTPKVNAILVGTSVVFPNHDNVRHQVYSFSRAKRFELPLYAGVPAQPVVFDTPGVVVLGCNIHDWMIGYVYVSESPYFAKSGADGKAVIADLTPRVYKVRVWHPQLDGTEESTQREIDLSHVKRVDATWTLKLKPETRVRRSPVGEHAGHY
jgi:plastocyanin